MKKSLLLLLVLPVVGAAFYLRSLASWRPRKVEVAEGPISRLVLSGDGKTLLVISRPAGPLGKRSPLSSPETTTALDVQSGFQRLWKRDHNLSTAPQFFDNNSKILVQPQRSEIEILDARTGKAIPVQGLNDAYISSFDGSWQAYNHAGKIIPAGRMTPFIRITPSGRMFAERMAPEARVFPAGGLNDVYVISPDGSWLVYNHTGVPDQQDTTDGRIYLKSTVAKNHRTQRRAPEKLIGRQSDSTPAFCFSPDGLTLAVGAGDKSGAHIDFYSTKTWKLTRTWSDVAPSLGNPRPSYQALQWSRDGHLFSSLTRVGDDMGQQVWRARDGKKVASGILLDNPHLENGGRVLTFGGDDGQVNLSYSPNLNHNFERLLSLPNQKVTAAALSPDGSYLFAGTQSGTVFYQRVK